MIDTTQLVARIDDEILMSIILGGLMFMIPIVAIMTHHQRKMAEIVRDRDRSEMMPALMDELQQLRREVQSMRTELNTNTIALDNMKMKSLPDEDEQGLSSRMKETQ